LRLSRYACPHRPIYGQDMGTPIRVLVADDHSVVRAGIKLLLEQAGLEPVGEASSGREAVFEARRLRPDVILLDLIMPNGSGLEVLPTLVHEHPQTKVVVLSMEDDPSYVRQAFDSGAAGYILKEAADTDVVTAIRTVAAGSRYVDPTLGARLVAAEATAAKRAADDPLSNREHEVLRLLALGYTNGEIAGELFISVRTAETHRSHILQKLHLATRADLVRYALEERLLEVV
jgi:two-component system, NarL family, response regulator NreC